MLTKEQKARLDKLDTEWVEVALARTEFTFDSSPRGIAEWNRLWARGLEIGEERKKLIGDKGVQPAQEVVSTQA